MPTERESFKVMFLSGDTMPHQGDELCYDSHAQIFAIRRPGNPTDYLKCSDEKSDHCFQGSKLSFENLERFKTHTILLAALMGFDIEFPKQMDESSWKGVLVGKQKK